MTGDFADLLYAERQIRKLQQERLRDSPAIAWRQWWEDMAKQQAGHRRQFFRFVLACGRERASRRRPPERISCTPYRAAGSRWPDTRRPTKGGWNDERN